jgi:hypothetical protein
VGAVEECIKAVCSSLTAAHERANSTTTPQVKTSAAEIAPLSTACDWASGDGKYVLFQLLCAATWIPRVVTTATPAAQACFPLTLALGRLFEATKLQSRFLRATSGHVVRFAAKWILEFADARCAAGSGPRTVTRSTRRGASGHHVRCPLRDRRCRPWLALRFGQSHRMSPSRVASGSLSRRRSGGSNELEGCAC